MFFRLEVGNKDEKRKVDACFAHSPAFACLGRGLHSPRPAAKAASAPNELGLRAKKGRSVKRASAEQAHRRMAGCKDGIERYRGVHVH